MLSPSCESVTIGITPPGHHVSLGITKYVMYMMLGGGYWLCDVLIISLVCCCLLCYQAFPVMMGEVEPSGNLNANIIHQFTKNLRCKFISQVRNSLVFIDTGTSCMLHQWQI